MQEQKTFDSPIEALKHLIENYDGHLPVDLNQAKYRIADNVRYTKTSKKVYPLRSAGALSMIKKYGGGRYTVTEVVVFSEVAIQQPNGPAFKAALEKIWAENDGDLDETINESPD